jgi:hypothetical protein
MRVETDIIVSITASPKGWATIVVIMYVKTFKIDVIVFMGNIIMCLTYKFQFQSIDTDNITQWD